MSTSNEKDRYNSGRGGYNNRGRGRGRGDGNRYGRGGNNRSNQDRSNSQGIGQYNNDRGRGGNRGRYNDNRGGQRGRYNDNRGGQRGRYNDNQGGQMNQYDDNDNYNDDYSNNYKIKQQLVNYVYNTVEIAKYKYELLEYEDTDLSKLDNCRHYVSPNYNGVNCLLVFKKIYDKYYSCLINRKTLSYNPQHIDINKVKVTPVNIQLDKSIYDGTIIDGVVLYNKKGRCDKTFVVNDIYAFRGQKMLNEKIKNKLINIGMFIESHTKEDTYLNDTELFVNKIYNLSKIKELVNVYIPKSKHSSFIKGLAFYPDLSGTKLVYLYNNCSRDNVVEKEKESAIIKNVREAGVKVGSAKTLVFRVKKTDTSDVYNIYLADISKDKQSVKYKKQGIAYIPTLQCSNFCKDLFDSINSDTGLIKCKYTPDNNGWVPFEHIIDRKVPDLVSAL